MLASSRVRTGCRKAPGPMTSIGPYKQFSRPRPFRCAPPKNPPPGAVPAPGGFFPYSFCFYVCACGRGSRARRVNQLSSLWTVTVPPYFSAAARTARTP